jgi:hypothetical protein
MVALGCNPSDRTPPEATSASPPAPEVMWPALPANEAQLDALLATHTRHALTPLEPMSADSVMAALEHAVEHGEAAGGFGAIVATLQREIDRRLPQERVYLLFGSHHDAGGQLDVFRRLISPLGVTPAPLAALEQLEADGRWAGVLPEAQRGNDEALRRWHEGESDLALAELLASQDRRNYTAWKFGYLDRVGDLLVAARASRTRLIGCDMPSALAAQVHERLGSRADELRDLHCAWALERALADTPRATVALFWGDAHLEATRLPRFLPALASIRRVHLLGQRASPDTGIESALPLRVTDPLLIRLSPSRHVLLLAGPHLGHATDRARARRPVDRSRNVSVRGAHGELRIGSERVTLDGQLWTTSLAEGPKTFVLHPPAKVVGAHAIAGAFEIPPRGAVELDFAEADMLRITVVDP